MTIQELLKQARLVLSGVGSTEIPSYPGTILNGWLHPDFFLRLLREETLDFFALQPLGSSAETGAAAFLRPVLAWWQKPFSVKGIAKVPEMIHEILWRSREKPPGEGLDKPTPGFRPGSEEGFFDIWGIEAPRGVLGETGCAWEFSWKGLPLGKIQMITQILGQFLKKPAGVVLFNLENLCSLAASDPAREKISWGKNLDLQSVFAWRDSGLELEIPQAKDMGRKVRGHLAKGSLNAAYHQILSLLSRAEHHFPAGEAGKKGRMSIEEELKPSFKDFAALMQLNPEARELEGSPK